MLKIYDDKTPVVLSQDTKKEALKKIGELYHLLSYLKQEIDDDKIDNTTVNTTMGLYESYYRELATTLGYDTILEQEHQERHVQIRQKNQEIRNLTEQLGKNMSPQAVTGAIRFYEDIFRAWYKNEGFHYASMTPGAYGFDLEFSEEMTYNHEDTINEKDSDIKKLIWRQEINTNQKNDAGWDLDPGKYKTEILDTDNNRKRIQDLILADFPNANIHGFRSRRNDNKNFAILTKCFVPHSDIANYYARKSAEKESETKNGPKI